MITNNTKEALKTVAMATAIGVIFCLFMAAVTYKAMWDNENCKFVMVETGIIKKIYYQPETRGASEQWTLVAENGFYVLDNPPPGIEGDSLHWAERECPDFYTDLIN